MTGYWRNTGKIAIALIVLCMSVLLAACGTEETGEEYSAASSQESVDVEDTDGDGEGDILTDEEAGDAAEGDNGAEAVEAAAETGVNDASEPVASGAEEAGGAGADSDAGAVAKPDPAAEQAPSSVQTPQEGEPSGASGSAESVEIMSNDGVTKMIFGTDGTYTFVFDQYGVEDSGTYTYMGGVLTLVNANGDEITAEGDPIALHYEYSQSSELSGDFSIPTTDLQ